MRKANRKKHVFKSILYVETAGAKREVMKEKIPTQALAYHGAVP